MTAFGYRYKLERQQNGWWLVRFPGFPEALTEGETEGEARSNAVDCGQTQTSLGCPISYLSALSRSRCRGVLWTRWVVLLKPRIRDAVQYIGRHSKQRRR